MGDIQSRNQEWSGSADSGVKDLDGWFTCSRLSQPPEVFHLAKSRKWKPHNLKIGNKEQANEFINFETHIANNPLYERDTLGIRYNRMRYSCVD